MWTTRKDGLRAWDWDRTALLAVAAVELARGLVGLLLDLTR